MPRDEVTIAELLDELNAEKRNRQIENYKTRI